MIVNTRKNAVNQLVKFIKSDSEKVVLIKGTNQFKKHSLVISLITQYECFKQGLFRSNSLQDIGLFLEQAGYQNVMGKKFAAGKSYNLSGIIFCFDSLFTRSIWGKSPNELDFALVYPLDSLCESKKELRNELLKDILNWKNIKKVFLVTCTDVRHDYTWLNDFVDRTVIYDADEEDPEYHQRVLDLKNNKF
jgi:hypothetical protein